MYINRIDRMENTTPILNSQQKIMTKDCTLFIRYVREPTNQDCVLFKFYFLFCDTTLNVHSLSLSTLDEHTRVKN